MAEAFEAAALDTHAEQPSPELAPEAGPALPEERRPEEPVAEVETVAPAVTAEEAPARADLPEPKLVTERPANPRRGWWSRG